MRGITEERLIEHLRSLPIGANEYDKAMNTVVCQLINECKELNPWQPIETAPKDRDLLLFDGINKYIGFWHNGGWINILAHLSFPTHWKELPDDPK